MFCFYWDFNLHSQVTNGSEHTFMCLSIICTSSFVKFLFRSFIFSVWYLIGELQLIIDIFIPDTAVPSGKVTVKNFHEYSLLDCACLVIFLVMSSEEHRVLTLIEHHLVFSCG